MYKEKLTLGLEAEVFVKNKETNQLVIASEADLPHDDFGLLAEIRGDASDTALGAYLNFLKAYHKLAAKVEEKGLVIDTEDALTISHAVYNKVMRLMGCKEFPTCQNVYGTDITGINDAVIDASGAIVGHRVSCGLHIHFGAICEMEVSVDRQEKFVYSPINLALTTGGDQTTIGNVTLYTKHERSGTPDPVSQHSNFNYINKITTEYLVKELDKALFDTYPPCLVTKYRQKGFYERKSYGFEYRSLPYRPSMNGALLDICKISFNLLRKVKEY